MAIKENIASLQREIAETCSRVQRKPSEISIVAVSKGQPISKIREVHLCGMMDFGENRAQELEEKYPELKALKPEIDIHFIGHLQSNKVKKVVEIADYIHSVDSLDLLRKIHYAALDMDKVQNIFLEVNTSGEKQKFGLPPHEV